MALNLCRPLTAEHEDTMREVAGLGEFTTFSTERKG